MRARFCAPVSRFGHAAILRPHTVSQPLIRLLYASRASSGTSYGALLGIMDHARDKNSMSNITGMLCYGSGQFLQALEGERQAVSNLYHRIAPDPRHTECQLIAVVEIGQRAFAEWSMKVVNWDDGASARRQTLLQADTGSSEFNPSGMTATQADTFLLHLAQFEREIAGE